MHRSTCKVKSSVQALSLNKFGDVNLKLASSKQCLAPAIDVCYGDNGHPETHRPTCVCTSQDAPQDSTPNQADTLIRMDVKYQNVITLPALDNMPGRVNFIKVIRSNPITSTLPARNDQNLHTDHETCDQCITRF